MLMRPALDQQDLKYRKQTTRRSPQSQNGLQYDNATFSRSDESQKLGLGCATKKSSEPFRAKANSRAVVEALDGLAAGPAQMEPTKTSPADARDRSSPIGQATIDALCAPLRAVITAAHQRTKLSALMTAASLIGLTSIPLAAQAVNPLTPSDHRWQAPRGYTGTTAESLRYQSERSPLLPTYEYGRHLRWDPVLRSANQESYRAEAHPLHPNFSRAKTIG